MPKKLTTEEFIEKAKKKHGNLYDYSKVEYITSHMPVKIFCKKCQKYFYQAPNNHLTGAGCYDCGNKRRSDKNRYSQEHFINKALSIHKGTYSYSEVKFKDMYTPVKIFCNKCKTYFYQTPSKHLGGRGCKKCSTLRQILSWDIQKSRLEKLGITKYLDFSFVQYKDSVHKIEVCCKTCGKHFFTLLGNLIAGKGCPYCRSSKGEKCIFEFLSKRNINFIRQHSFPGCKSKKLLYFDFYLPSYNICIEYQGEQHYKKFRFEKNNTKLKERQQRDQIKRNYCAQNNIKLLEIRYDENIEEVLTKTLGLEDE